MAVSLISNIDLAVKWAYENPLDLSTASDRKTLNFNTALGNGTGLDQANRIFADERTLATTASDDFDLAGGLTDIYGQTLTLTKVKAIVVYNTATVAGEILTVGGGSNPFITWIGDGSDTVKVFPEGLLALVNPSLAGYTVTASTGDILRVTNSGASNITYRIVLIGTQ